MNITVLHLRSFLVLARELHFGRAAQRLNISPSTLSEQIAMLEKRLQMKLFTRTSRTVEPTGAASELIPLAEKVIGSMDELLHWASSARPARELRVGVMVSSPHFQQVMAEASRAMPDISWTIHQLGFVGCDEALAGNTVDCAFVGTLDENPTGDFQALPLWRDNCMLVLSQHHRLASRDSVRWEDLRGEKFIGAPDSRQTTSWLAPLATAIPGQYSVLPLARNFEEILDYCAAGLGVNICAQSAAQIYARPALRFVPIGDAPQITTHLVVPAAGSTPAVEEFARLAVRVSHQPT
ncbi:LysR family transcriptional regulator [Glutamicibacter sp. MNS18]|uniref:LysR family transcriptional regulator n=1 Tax=Glutamicibacter sp. MNS18 TaxID=2989817 RepID=UPI002235A4A7|nr:LysR family transcriptional regulator [Glutamicibacter sp. MNS18]MCW4465425.1 LysR family transcriptional regulator [Glutamicibacter sp. MNS18]